MIADFFALDPAFRGGITVAAADLTGDHRAEVAVGAGPGGGPRVAVYDPLTGGPVAGPLGSFYAGDPAGRGGVWVGASSLAGDVDGDGVPDLAVGSGPGVAPEVEVVSGADGSVLRDFAPFDPSATGGVRVALAYIDDDPYADVVAGTGPGPAAAVRVFSGATTALLPAPVGSYAPFGTDTGGVYVAASNDPTLPGVDPVYATPTDPDPGAAFTVVGGVFSQETPVAHTPTGSLTFKVRDTSTEVTTTLGSATLAGDTFGHAAASLDYPTGLPTGSYDLWFEYSGDAQFLARSSVLWEMDVTAPPEVALTGLADDTGYSASDRVTKDNTLGLFGTATPNSHVDVYTQTPADPDPVWLGAVDATAAGTVTYGTAALPDGPRVFTAVATLGGKKSAPSAPLDAIIDTVPPTVGLTFDENPTKSTRPWANVTGYDQYMFPPDAQVAIDVDLTGDGDFDDPGETGFTSGTLLPRAIYETKQLHIQLPHLAVGTYPVRARITDRAGNEGSGTTTLEIDPAGWDLYDATPQDRSGYGGLWGWTTAEDGLVYAGNVTTSLPLDLDLGSASCGCQDAALVYNSAEVTPDPVVQVVLQSDNSASDTPDQVVGTLTWDGAVVGNPTFEQGDMGEQWVLSVQPGGDQPTGRHTYALDLFVDYPGTSADRTLSFDGYTFVVNEDASPFGAGWSFSNTDRLTDVPDQGTLPSGTRLPAGELRAFGRGGWAFYPADGTGYDSPLGDGGTLAAAGGGYTYTGPGGEVLTFDGSGRMTGWADRSGTELFTYAYDGSDRLSTMTAPDTGVATFAYDAGGHATSVTGPGNRVTTLTQVEQGGEGGEYELTGAADPGGGLHTYAYDDTHHLTAEAAGQVRGSYAYTLGGLADGADSPAYRNLAFTPGLAQQGAVPRPGAAWAQVIDGDGNKTLVRLNRNGQRIEVQAPDGGVWRWVRDGADPDLYPKSAGYVTELTDPLGRVTDYLRDAAGRPTRVTVWDANLPAVWTYTYDTYGALTRAEDPLLRVTSYAYTALGQLRAVTDPLGGLTTLTWTGAGLLESVTDPLGRRATSVYDAYRRLVGELRAGDPTGTFLYDAYGEPAGSVDPLGATTTVVNDVMGRPVARTDPGGGLWTAAYDPGSGLLIGTTAPTGRRAVYGYDAHGNLTVQVDGAGIA